MLHPPPPNPNIDSRTFARAAEKAEEDLRSFYLECTNPDPSVSQWLDFRLRDPNWENVCDMIKNKVLEEQKKDNTYPSFPDCEDALHFFEELLAWLDKTKAELKWPWRSGTYIREIKKDASYIFILLDSFKVAFLDGHCTPRPQKDDSNKKNNDVIVIQDELLINIWMLLEFLEFVGKHEVDKDSWVVRLVSTADGPPVVAHFLSWLIVDHISKTLYILYNDEKISQGAKDEYERITRLETAFLHELGHAVNHLDWYKEKLTSNNPQDMYYRMGYAKKYYAEWIGVPAWHEFEAWAYAFAIRGCVKSTRSWIKRLLEEIDDEWRHI